MWCAFVGVLRSQASCFSLLVGFSWLEILLFTFYLCGCETLALLLNLAIILLCLLGLTLFALPHCVMSSRHRYRFILLKLMTFL